MFRHYQMTALEEFLEVIYSRIGIIEPHQITVEEISHRLNVWVHYANVRSRALESVAGMYSMFLDSRTPSKDQHLEFLHELCHLLRHAGNQTVLPELFTQAQEHEANLFVMYAAIPFSMFAKLSIPDQRGEAINYIAHNFQVTHEFAEQRLDQIQRRELQGLFDAVMNEHTVHNEVAATSEVPTGGTSVYAYYDSNTDTPGPSQIIIDANTAAMNSKSDLFFPVDGPFERLEIDNLHDYKCTQLSIRDFRYKDGQIGIDFPAIYSKYGGAAKRFLLQMKDIEQVLIFENGDF